MRWFSSSNVMIVGPFLVSSTKLTFFVFKKWRFFVSLKKRVRSIGYFPIALSVPVAFNQHIHNKTNQCILRYTKKVQNSARVDMPRDLQMLLMSLFRVCSCNDWASKVQSAARMRPNRRFGAAHQVFVVVKLSDILTACPYFDNILILTFLMQVVFSATLSRLLPLQLGFERFNALA